ncbi:MAG TPA: phage tail tube protein [Kiloniellaceae bacterium]|nr:phage tail tube protein [Kiloniellaceae bacterium]
MAFADSSETEIAFIPESVFGTTPATPVFQRMRVTSEDLMGEQQTTVSNELRPDAEVADLIRVGESATGNLPFELSFGSEFDTLFEHALRGSFAANELKAGIEKKSISLEKRHETGATDHYFRFVGCRVGQMSLNLKAQEIVTGSLQIMGLSEATDTAIISGATYTDANSNPVMAAADVGTITVGGVAGTLYYTDLSFSLNNNLRAQPAIGQVGAAGIGYGRREITGSIIAYFEDDDLYEEAVQNNSSSLSFALSDGSNSYSVTLPKLKFTSRKAVAGGNNQDIMAECQFQALYDPTEQTSIKIVKA